jgi:small conductance mechanosensitive channel
MNDQAQNIVAWKDKLVDYMILHSGAMISAAVVIVVGLLAARWLGKLVNGWLSRKAMEPPMRMLVIRILKLMIFAVALVIALGTAGMDVTALIAGIGVAGVGLGLAVQGVLSNLVAGLTIIFTKPYRLGEYIEIVGVQGVVKTIELFTTTLEHGDRSRVVIPNRKIVGEILHNYGNIRQLNLTVGVSYGTDINSAVAIVRGVLEGNSRVLKDPKPWVGITLLTSSSISIAVNPWTTVNDYDPAGTEIYQGVVEQFRINKIEIPLPQREVRLLNNP